MLGREEISELTTYKKQKKKGFAAIVALISLASLVLPCVALGGSDRNNMAVFGGSNSPVFTVADFSVKTNLLEWKLRLNSLRLHQPQNPKNRPKRAGTF